jgi:hypothetical protein
MEGEPNWKEKYAKLKTKYKALQVEFTKANG